MWPTGDELRRRLIAARELRGIEQDALGALFEADGLGSTDPGRIERGNMAMTRSRLDAFIRHLQVPERWLTAEDVDDVLPVGPGEDEVSQRLADLEERLAAIALDGETREVEVLRRLDEIEQTIRQIPGRRQL